MARRFEDCEDLFIRYTSATTIKDKGGQPWQGKVRSVVPDEDGEVEINGARHNVASICVLEVIYFDI